MASVQLEGFKPGDKVEARLRGADFYRAGDAVVSSAKAGKDGSVSVTGLTVGAQYWVSSESGEVRAVQAKDASFSEDAILHRDGPEATQRRIQQDRQAQADAIAQARKRDPLHGSPAPGRTVEDNTPERKSPSVAEPQPGPRQQEFSGPQRSDTPDGEATPKDPQERVPDVRQEDVGRAAQRSSTETGVAAVKDPNEVVPSLKQEDVPKSTPQRSSTETGQAEPKPPVRQVKRRDDSSANRARGNTPAKAEEQTTKPPVKDTTKTGTRKRASTRK